MSKFLLKPEPNKKYYVKIRTSNGEEITHEITDIKKRGFTLVSNERKQDFVFAIRTNNQTPDSLKNQTFFMAIHKNGAIKDFGFKFPENQLEATIPISKDSLFKGVNTVTIFNQKKEPILERLIFNNKNIDHKTIEARMARNRGDSISIALTNINKQNNISLSVSVLPNGTKAYNPQHNILSAFYLKPYLNGIIENASYYFSKGDEKRKQFHLDLLLLTQGWSKYSWKDIKHNPPLEQFNSEQGFTIEGKVINRNEKRENHLMLRSDVTGSMDLLEVNEDGSFKLENTYLVDNTDLFLGTINDRNSKIKSRGLSFTISPTKLQSKSRIKIPSLLLPKTSLSTTETRKALDFIENITLLDSVYLETKKQKPDNKYYDELKVFEQKIHITEAIEQRYQLVTDYLNANGFHVRTAENAVDIEILSRMPFSLGESPCNFYPLVIFDGMTLRKGDFHLLQNLFMERIESITINKFGHGYGMQGGNGVIKIETKSGPSLRSNNYNYFNSYTATNGFSPNKKFYAPRYSSYSSESFINYGAIEWYPEVTFNNKGQAQFKIFNISQPGVTLFIEGMSAQGDLISEVIYLDIN